MEYTLAVFVLDNRKRPLMPCSEKRARLLLERKRAVVHRVWPFTIRLKGRKDGDVQPIRVKLDPGSKVTGIVIVREVETVRHLTGAIRPTVCVLHLAGLTHRGLAIRDALVSRRILRRARRHRKTRYRVARFHNRRRLEGWLPPSLQHRIDTTLTWVKRLQWCGISARYAVRNGMPGISPGEVG